MIASTTSAITPSASSAAVCPGELLLGADRRGAARAGGVQRARRAATSTPRPTRPVVGQSVAAAESGAIGAAAPRGQTPASANSSNNAPATSQNAARLRNARKAGPSRTCRRRERAKRSTAADEERQERSHQHELDRPAADDPIAEPDVARRALGELEPRVERAEQVLRGAADDAELAQPQQLRLVGECLGRTAAGGRDRDRRDPVADERRLLVEAEREGEVDQLRKAARSAGDRARLLLEPGGGSPQQRRGGRARDRSPANSSLGEPVPAIASRLTTATTSRR